MTNGFKPFIRRPGIVKAKQVQADGPITCTQGVFDAKAGDWICQASDKTWVVEKDVFHVLYEQASTPQLVCAQMTDVRQWAARRRFLLAMEAACKRHAPRLALFDVRGGEYELWYGLMVAEQQYQSSAASLLREMVRACQGWWWHPREAGELVDRQIEFVSLDKWLLIFHETIVVSYLPLTVRQYVSDPARP